MSGSAVEPSAQHAAEQMRAATDRLRDKAWMVSPMTSVEASTPDEHAETGSAAEV